MEGKVIYKELSYIIMGVLFEVDNELGFGYREKIYENAIAETFNRKKIGYRRQASYQVLFKGKEVGRHYLDFIVEDKVVLEIKRGNYMSPRSIKQVIGYLKVTNMKLAILASFTINGVKFHRLLNNN